MKLEIKHIAPYLPYGLPLYMTAYTDEVSGRVELELAIQTVEQVLACVNRGVENKHYFPILKPLTGLKSEDISSCYYSEILHNWRDIEQDLSNGTAYLKAYNYLVSNHYDVFGLIDNGLAIDINEVKG